MGKLVDELKAAEQKVAAEVPVAESWIRQHAGVVLALAAVAAAVVACSVLL